MSILTFPSSIRPEIPFKIKQRYSTLVSDFDSGGDQSQRLWRFSKLILPPIQYVNIVPSNRDTLSNFFRACYGRHKPFWFFDFVSRHWTDVYVGQGGPLTVGGALRYTASSGLYVDETDHANDTTAGDVNILPAAGAGNAYLIGSPTQFDKVTFTISTPGAGTYTISGKYWDGDSLENIALTDGTTNFKAAAGDRDITFTIPAAWTIDERKNIDMYWLWFVADGGTVTTPPVCSKVTVNSKTYDLHGKTIDDATLKICIDSVLKTGGGTDYSFVSGGGAGSADRITLVNYASQGALVASDLDGFLRIKAKFDADDFPEEIHLENEDGDYFLLEFPIREIQW